MSDTTTTSSTPANTEEKITMLPVSTVPAMLVPKGHLQLVANTRATVDKATGKKKEIPADQKCRALVIPEFMPSVSSKYVSLVVGALTLAATEQLRQLWQAEPMLREVAASLFTEDGVLAFAAREAESKKLTTEAIEAWYNASALCKYVAKHYDEKAQKKFLASLTNVAAPTLSPLYYDEERALKKIATLGKFEEDVEHDVCKAMIVRLTRYVEAIRKQREDIGDADDVEL